MRRRRTALPPLAPRPSRSQANTRAARAVDVRRSGWTDGASPSNGRAHVIAVGTSWGDQTGGCPRGSPRPLRQIPTPQDRIATTQPEFDSSMPGPAPIWPYGPTKRRPAPHLPRTLDRVPRRGRSGALGPVAGGGTSGRRGQRRMAGSFSTLIRDLAHADTPVPADCLRRPLYAPAIRLVGASALPVEETWTKRLTDISADGSQD